jgi:hypothetical protein
MYSFFFNSGCFDIQVAISVWMNFGSCKLDANVLMSQFVDMSYIWLIPRIIREQ